MGLKDWLGTNHYVTKPGDTDPFFRPRKYGKSKPEVAALVRETLSSLRELRLEEYRENQGLFRITRSVLFPPSAQDINIYVVQGLDETTGVEMTSVSRGGKRDWGQNKRNLREILAALDSKLKPLQ